MKVLGMPGTNASAQLIYYGIAHQLDNPKGARRLALRLRKQHAALLPCAGLTVDAMRAACRFKGIRQPARTFLLYGPPGTGKTLLVEKVAAEAGFMLLSLSPSMILSKWAGDSEKAISGVFDIAKSLQPCIIFLVGRECCPHVCVGPTAAVR
jgi:hypothetical protein